MRAVGVEARFHRGRAPTDEELCALSEKIHTRVVKWLAAHGYTLGAEAADGAEPTALESCVQATLRLGQLGALDARGRVTAAPKRRGQRRKASGEAHGFSLDASVVIAARDKAGRERLSRYCARPAFALERLCETEDGRLAYLLKYPRQGATHLVMMPLELLQRLSPLVAPQRWPLVVFAGCFARPPAAPRLLTSRALRREHQARETPTCVRDAPCPMSPPCSQPRAPRSASPRAPRASGLRAEGRFGVLAATAIGETTARHWVCGLEEGGRFALRTSGTSVDVRSW